MTRPVVPEEQSDVRSYVREHYGAIAEKSMQETQAGCCASPAQSSCCGPSEDSQTIALEQVSTVARLYQDTDVAGLPPEVTGISMGCGDPITLASLQPGETVLDLGSGGGIDCFLAAKKVGPSGHVIGVDMTAAMIEKARANQKKIGATNVEFRLGEIEHLPVADGSVDVIISNCVINLSPDKPQVFREAYRVLRAGGKLAVSDIVTDGPLPEVVKSNLSAWAGCLAGAWDVRDYVRAMEEAGFRDVQVTPSYWDEEVIDEAVAQLDPEVVARVEEARREGKTVMVVGESGGGEIIEIEASEGLKDFDPKKAVYSALITALKGG